MGFSKDDEGATASARPRYFDGYQVQGKIAGRRDEYPVDGQSSSARGSRLEG